MKTVYLLALAAVVACAAKKSDRASPNLGSDRNVITEEEIRSVPASNLYELVAKLRPQMLRAHGQSTLGAARRATSRSFIWTGATTGTSARCAV